MKHCLLLTFLGCTSFLMAQNYINNTARWVQYFGWSGPESSISSQSTFYFDGDSSYQGKTYLKKYNHLVRTDTYFTDSGSYNVLTDKVLYVSLFREENQKFYGILKGETEEQLHFDFSRSPSDLITDAIPYDYSCGPETLLGNYSYVCIGPEARKKWNVGLIEGVGTVSGTSVCWYDGCPECSYNLVSFELNGYFLYMGNCDLTEAPEHADATLLTNPYPNPITDQFTIFFAQSDSYQLRFYTTNGQMLWQKTISGDSFNYNCPDLAPGVYYIHIENDGQKQVKRVVKL